MKIKKGYVLKEIGDSCVVVPIGEAAKTFKGVIALNETAKVLWLTLEKGADLESTGKPRYVRAKSSLKSLKRRTL